MRKRQNKRQVPESDLGDISVTAVAKDSDNVVSWTELASHFDCSARIEGSCWAHKKGIIPEKKISHFEELLVTAKI